MKTITECEIKIKDLQRYQLLSYSKEREKEIEYYKKIIRNIEEKLNQK